jgi:aspartate kinase/aspartokinase/homoserine dehydrogenase 1
MKKIVVKFGGSNLKKQEDILKVVEVIKLYKNPLVIVVSAFYGVTNYLTDIIVKAKTDESAITTFTESLTKFKTEIINTHISDREIRDETTRKVFIRLKELQKYLLGVNYIGDVPEFVEDEVLSYGERLSSIILTGILKDNGIKCEEVLPEDLKLITNGDFHNATVDFDISEKNVRERLNEDQHYIVPGFYGVSTDGRTTLFGRGGSDYSAAAIAKCVEAESLDLWKDVEGFMSADPKLISDPVVIRHLTYNEAAELSYFGAKIMHPRTVEPLLDINIPIHIYNINNYEEEFKPVTVISSGLSFKTDVIKSVTYNDDFCILKLNGPAIGASKGLMARIGTALDNEGINMKCIINSQTAINLLFSRRDLYNAYNIISRLNIKEIHSMFPVENISTIAVVGNGMTEIPGIAGRIFTAVARKGINIIIIFFGATDVSSYFIVKSTERDESIRQIHAEFF